MRMLDFNHGAATVRKDDPAALRRELISRLPSLLPILYPAGKSLRGKFLIGDVLGSPGRSLEVVLDGDKAGLWTDRATGQGGDVFDLIAHAHGIDAKQDFVRLLTCIRELLGQTTVAPAIMPGKRKKKETAIGTLGPATAKWQYLDAEGELLAVVYRYDPPGQKKEFRPWDAKRRKMTPPDPRPLYHQPGIAQADTVVLVEGEKCAQALIDVGICATTAMHGANAPVDKTDWRPLAGKRVLIWPDRDKAGWAYATAAGYAALAAGAHYVALLIPPDGPADGWDVADAIGEGMDVSSFLATGPRTELKSQGAAEPAGVESGECSVSGTEDALALQFTRAYARDWQYVALWNKWLVWDSRCWRTELTLQATDLIRHVCREAALKADSARTAAKLASSGTVSGVERLARTDRGHAAYADSWDADPWLLNTPGGAIDLKSGRVHAHRREDRMTRITTASVTAAQACPAWTQFLRDVTGNNDDLIGYLQRMVGYCLTGVTSEHALFFLYGTGANGKSVFVNTIANLVGDYATNAPMDTFMETRSDRHPTDMAGLRGARFVSSIETEQGRRWAESKIKALTGGDKISARFMRQDFFEYIPQFKLVIAGNHKPTIRNVDEAMKRRLHLIPFTVTIPPDKRDKHLPEKLLAERDAIMAWALQGCLAWQREGLRPPQVVLDATDEYFEEEDAIGEFVNEECNVSQVAREGISSIYQRWRERTDKRGEYVGTSRWLVQQLVMRGFERIRLPGGIKGLSGLSLKPKEQSNYLPYRDD
jgi:putative DNA primase/helicase